MKVHLLTTAMQTLVNIYIDRLHTMYTPEQKNEAKTINCMYYDDFTC